MSRRQSACCASDLRLDRLLAGELPASDAAALRVHLAECAPCHARHEALQREHRVLAAQLPALTLPGYSRAPGSAPAPDRRLERQRSAHRLWPVAASLAAAVALWAVVQERTSPQRLAVNAPSTADATRTKGSSAVQLDWTIQRGSEVFLARPEDVLHPGDALRFGVRASRGGYAAVLSLDSERRSTVYHDWVAVAAGERQLLPGAVALDGVLGDEHLYAVVCDRSSALGELEAAIRRWPARPELPPDCVADHHVLRKGRP